jgi:hypothetical protein
MRTDLDGVPMGPFACSATLGGRSGQDGLARVHPHPMRTPRLPECAHRAPADRITCEPDGAMRGWNGGAGPAIATRTPRPDREGFSLLGAVILLMALSGGTGLWISARHLRAITERQVNFDRCTGTAVLRIRSWITEHERSWKRLEAARAITTPLLPTPAGPAALESFRILLGAERAIQERIRAEWIRESLRWNLLTGLGCRLRRRPERSVFPEHDLNLVDPNAEVVLADTSIESPVPRSEYRVGVASRNQNSSAMTRRATDDTWKVQWIP